MDMLSPTASLNVVHLSEDETGESHFDSFRIDRRLVNFAPPANPFLVSAVERASGYVVVRIPAGWIGERHPSPHRQIAFCLSGALKVTASDGDFRVIKAGDAWLMTDTQGKGHESKVVSDNPWDAVIILVENSD
jgi:quercetin dioxygenase-like cupin family protein